MSRPGPRYVCPDCGGSGGEFEDVCTGCFGSGAESAEADDGEEGDPHLVEGSPKDPRRLTIDFPAFVERLEATPELDHEKLVRLCAGADLIDSLAAGGGRGFGEAAPGVGEDADIAEQIMALTDEAFETGAELLETADPYDDDYLMDHQRRPARNFPPEVEVALLKLLGHTYHTPARALRGTPPAIECAVGKEFI